MTGPEPEVYTPWEAAQIALVVARTVRAGRPTARLDRQLEAIKARAVAREAAETALAEERAARKIRDKAAKRR